MPKNQMYLVFSLKTWSDLKKWAEQKQLLSPNMPPNKERPDSCRSALPARLICAPGPFVGLIPYIS
jgi:hypothetical protein